MRKSSVGIATCLAVALVASGNVAAKGKKGREAPSEVKTPPSLRPIHSIDISSSRVEDLTRMLEKAKKDDEGKTFGREYSSSYYLGHSYSSGYGSSYSSSAKVVTEPHETGLEKYDVRIAVCGSSMEPSRDAIAEDLRNIGRLAARKGFALLTGGGDGHPRVAAKYASLNSGMTVAFPQHAGRSQDYQKVVYDTQSTTIGRESALTQQGNILAIVNGSTGTLGELLGGMYSPHVIALDKHSGGVADLAMKGIIPYIDLPDYVHVIEHENMETLLTAAVVELDKIPGAKKFPERHELARLEHHDVFRSSAYKMREEHSVVTLLVNDNKKNPLSKMDRKKVDRFAELINHFAFVGDSTAGIRNTVVVPDRDGLTAELAKKAAASGAYVVRVSHKKVAGQGPVKEDGITTVYLGKGEAQGEFAAQRELVENARVVFVAGGDFKTLSAVVHALSEDTTIAVLETEGGVSGHLKNILTTLDKGTRARLVYDDDPDRLFLETRRSIEERQKEARRRAEEAARRERERD